MNLFNMLLSLMNKQQLWGDDDPSVALVELFGSSLFLIGLDGQIPDRD